MTRRKLLHRLKEVCGATRHMMDDGLAILVSQVRCYYNLYLLSFIVTMYWTKFLYELYSNSRVLIHYNIEGHYFILFYVSIIGCHNCSYSAILIVFCTFKFSSMTLSLSLLHVHWILCYRIKNISFMVFIKQLKLRIFVCCYTDWSLAFKGEGCGFESTPWDWKKISSFLFLHFLPSFP